jgi:WXXGXW repeat (2 copies)
MLIKKVLLATLIATGAIGTMAIAPAATAAVVYIQTAPPAPRYEEVPTLRRGYVWVPGYWNWNGRRHVWVRGYSVRERHGYAYRPHAWVEDNGRWRMQRGGWDRDGDGVPNNRDRAPDNPRVQ